MGDGSEGVDGHPLEGSEGREHLAVMEAGGGLDLVVGRGAHHGGTDHQSVSQGVVHEGPDP